MKVINMLAVTPYEGLGDVFANCAKSFPGIRLDVAMGNMGAAAQNMERYQGYDVVVSRGGTARILRESLERMNIPVMGVEVSAYDMLRVIKTAQQSGKKFAIVGFDELIETSRLICEILRYKVPTYTIESEEDAERVIGGLPEKGVELVVGDVVTTEWAEKAAIPSLLLTSGTESVEKALKDVMELFLNLEKIKRASPFKNVISAPVGRLKVLEHEECVRIESPDPAWRQTSAAPAFLDAERLRIAAEKAGQSARQLPILIQGRPGTGVSAFARYIHTAGPFKNSLFISVDSRGLNEKSWRGLVRHTDSPIHGLKCSLFFHNVHLLDYGVQNMLLGYMEDTLLAKRHQVISSSSEDLAAMAAPGEFLPALRQNLAGLTLSLPSLSERPEEIPALASLLISRFNREYARQLIGFDDEAMEYLKNRAWELNLEELQNLIRQLAILAEKPYITLEDVQKNMAAFPKASPNSFKLDLSKTFAEIEKDVIKHVLTEEDHNQSRAAKRLGIARSTLWRKIGRN